MCEKIILICLGALISIVTSVINKLIDNWANKKGEVFIFRKLVSYMNKSAGIYMEKGEIKLVVPLWIEIQNTKKIPTIIRDFSLAIYKDGKLVKKMKQINYKEVTIEGVSSKRYYGDRGKYSFYIQPENINRYELLFVLKMNEFGSDFDEIKMNYYGNKNNLITHKLLKVNDSWSVKQFNTDDDWIQLKQL